MTEFERNWTHAEQEQQARLLHQLKREIVAKRQAEQAQAKTAAHRSVTSRSTQRVLAVSRRTSGNGSSPPKASSFTLKQTVRGNWEPVVARKLKSRRCPSAVTPRIPTTLVRLDSTPKPVNLCSSGFTVRSRSSGERCPIELHKRY